MNLVERKRWKTRRNEELREGSAKAREQTKNFTLEKQVDELGKLYREALAVTGSVSAGVSGW